MTGANEAPPAPLRIFQQRLRNSIPLVFEHAWSTRSAKTISRITFRVEFTSNRLDFPVKVPHGQRRTTHSDDGTVSPHQKRAAQRRVAPFPPWRFFRTVFRGCPNRRATAQCGPHQTRCHTYVRHPFSRRKFLYRPHSQSGTESCHL